METSLEIKIIVPIVPLWRPELHWNEYFESGITELLHLDGILEFSMWDLGIFKVRIFLSDESSYYNGISYKIVVFQISVPNHFQKLQIETTSDETCVSEKQSFFNSVVSGEFSSKLYYFLILCNIAKPGIIKAKKGTILVNNEIQSSEFYPIISLHRETLDEVKKMKWPEYRNLEYLSVWNWFNENGFSFERHSKSKTERALNAFTYLFKDNLSDMIFDLFWSLIGIEAIYCQGKEGLSEQIYTKSQVFLGDIIDFKKRLKKMYELRSRLIHGDIDIPPNNFELEDEEEEKFQEGLHESASLSVSILTATLQKMVEKQIKEFNFRYIVE